MTQRALYQINRLRLYWLDPPSAYENERSRVLLDLQERLEVPWQAWLARQIRDDPQNEDAPVVLRRWAARDRVGAETEDQRWVAERMNLAGYRRLLEIASLNGLVEASQLSRVLGGAASSTQATLFRILMEEYGAGRPDKKHSSFFARMLQQQGLSAAPEAHLERVPWEVLSAINHSFYLAENKRHYLRFCGAFTYTELSTPASFESYAKAALRLGLSDGRSDYWSLHMREDERHGAWMLEDVAIPLLESMRDHQHDVLFGYAQQSFVETLAAGATTRACREAAEAEAA
jgi:hypothetical protein